MFKKYHPIWLILICSLAAFLVWYFRIILLYLFFAMCLTFILTPVVNFLSKRKIRNFRLPRMLATIGSFLLLILVIFLFFLTIFPLVSQEIRQLRTIDPNQFTTIFDNQIYYFENVLIENHLVDQQPGFLKPFLSQKINHMVDEESATSFVTNLFNGITTGAIAVFSVFFITFFSLKDENLLKKALANIIPGKYYVDYIGVFNKIENLLSRYFIGLLIQASIISLIVTIALMIFGVQNAILIGILVGILNVIPYLGQVISVFVAIALGIASNINILNSAELFPFILTITLIVIATQTLDSFIFQPLIFSKSVKAHPLEIFLMVFVGGTIAGPFGMFLSIPIYTVLKVTYVGLHGAWKKKQLNELKRTANF